MYTKSTLKDKEEFNFIPPKLTTADISHRIGNHLLLCQNHPPQADGFCLSPTSLCIFRKSE